ncbi:hypothetical protein [Pseudoduganella sp. OTU4001]|uniref:hypothetical protein n=1 Tax=Pseudoduganella sp. OTU4001 TaxID=3043854 RepID=UPI00313D7871
MNQLPLAVVNVGLVTGVGHNAASTCAAIRAAVDNFEDTGFVDGAGEWIRGCQVAVPQSLRGSAKLKKMAAEAIAECLAGCPESQISEIPLLFCGPERERKGQPLGDEREFMHALQEALGGRLHPASKVIAQGHASIAFALQMAREMIQHHGARRVLVAAADSLLVSSTLDWFEGRERLLTSKNSNGFIAGEAGAAILLEAAAIDGRGLTCIGLGIGKENATIHSDQPLRADGLCEAIRNSLSEAGWNMGDIDFRICDLAGEQYHFKEASLALLRLLRQRKEEFDIWHPADCIGEVGAAIGLVLISVLKVACEKGYSKGHRMLAHLGNDDGTRAAMVFTWRQNGA